MSGPHSRAAIYVAVLSLSLASGCKDDKQEDDEDSESIKKPASQQQPAGDDGDGSDDSGDDGDGTDGFANCLGMQHGEAYPQLKYAAETAVKGLEVCESEEQIVSCDDGVITSTGTFEYDVCTPVAAALERGDILVLREDGGTGIGSAGEILAFSPAMGFKGVAYDSAGVVPWYGYGLRVSRDFFGDVYSVEMGSANQDLAISLRKFPQIESYPHTLGNWVEGPASDADNFQGAMSEEHRTIRYVAKDDGQELHVYSQSDGALANCTISMPMGQHARAIFYGTQRFSNTTLVAYTLGTGNSVTGYGVAKLTGAPCSDGSGMPMTVTSQFENTNLPDAKVTGITQIRGGTLDPGSWTANDVFVAVGSFLYGQSVVHWHFDGSTWSEEASPFQDTARAIYQDYEGDVYTIERDGTSTYLRRYGLAEVSGTHFIETIHTDADESILADTSLGQWLIVMPELVE